MIKLLRYLKENQHGKIIKMTKLPHSSFIRLSEAPEVWHGTHTGFDAFSTAKINTGEGNQTYGWGLYFTDKKQIAEWYKNTVSRDVEGPLLSYHTPCKSIGIF